MPDAATALKDVTNPPAEPKEPSQTADSKAATITVPVDTANKDAAEIGQLLLDSGIDKSKINELLEAPSALAAIRYQLENDPAEFVRGLERANPAAGEKLLDSISKLYVDRYARDDKSGNAGGKTDDKTNELQDQLRVLSEKVTGFETQAQRSANAAAMAAVNARYEARVDDLFSQLPADKVPLTSTEKALIKDALSSRLGRDSDAAKRVYNGNFVDVPKAFKGIVEGLLNDRKAAADAEKAARDRSTKASFPEFGAGPIELPKDFYDVSDTPLDKLWDTDGFVNAVTK
ncbi:MAG TPA: hypothetical protein VNB49_09235 [Candidatus Dormibacteraeota bacterium]|nr:hypothetical protein [Candidatus Dormibacteraeota bacterium]